nr:MAG TPA: protein of unknown function (DUF2011) [Caudoviricetes sp.]
MPFAFPLFSITEYHKICLFTRLVVYDFVV